MLGVVEPDIHQRRSLHVIDRQLRHFRHDKRLAGQRAQFAGDADHAVPVRPVGRDLQIINHIIAGAAQMLGKRLAHLGLGREQQQAVGILGDAQLLGRAHHAAGFHTANLADLDLERLLTWLSGHLAAGQRQRHLAANLKIRRTADDLPHALAVVHLAERQAVGVRVLLLLQHLGDYDVLESAGHLLHALDLEPNHGQLLGEFLGRRVEVDVLLQPVVGNFHFLGESGENRGAAEYAKTGKMRWIF